MIRGNLPSVRVHAGQDVYPGGVHQAGHLLVPGQVGRADVVSQVQQELATQDLIMTDIRSWTGIYRGSLNYPKYR